MMKHVPINISNVNDLFEYYNINLFNGILTIPQIEIISSIKKAPAFYYPNCAINKVGKIIIQLKQLKNDETIWHPHFVHQMVHLWQHQFGTPSKQYGYHNREWSLKMQRIGLWPTSTSQLDGYKVGKEITQIPIPHGYFQSAFEQIPRDDHLKLRHYHLNSKDLSTPGHYIQKGSQQLPNAKYYPTTGIDI